MSKQVVLPISDWREILYAARTKAGMSAGWNLLRSSDVAGLIASMNSGTAASVNATPWTLWKTNGSLDSYAMYLSGQLASETPFSESFSTNIYPGFELCLRGWMACSGGLKLADVGYYFDDYDTMPVWQGEFGEETEEAVAALGGVRFKIGVVDMPSFGEHVIHYIGKISDATGSVVSFSDVPITVVGGE